MSGPSDPIEHLGTEWIVISQIKLDFDMDARRKRPSVAIMQGSIEEIGTITPIMVRKRDMLIIAGRDRLAATMNLGELEVEATLVEVHDALADKIRLHENAIRRHSPEEARSDRAELLVKYETSYLADKPLASQAEARTAAINKVAEEEGVKPESVKRQQKRERERAAEKEAEVRAEPIPLYGAKPPTEKWAVDMTDWKKASGSLLAALKVLTGIGVSYDIPQYEETMMKLSAFEPVSICPYCKSIEELAESCDSCAGYGVRMRGNVGNVPAELTDADNPRVMVEGTIMDMQAYLDMPFDDDDEPFDALAAKEALDDDAEVVEEYEEKMQDEEN